MRIAIPLFDGRVAPRFDCAQRLLVIDGGQDDAPSGHTESPLAGPPHERIRALVELGADVLICGGIDCLSASLLARYPIRVFSWVTGEADDALAAFLAGALESGAIMGAGGRCCGRWRFRHGGLLEMNEALPPAVQQKERALMPRGDGTGPMGKGPGTGRGRGRRRGAGNGPAGAGRGVAQDFEQDAGQGRGQGRGQGGGGARGGQSGGRGRGQGGGRGNSR